MRYTNKTTYLLSLIIATLSLSSSAAATIFLGATKLTNKSYSDDITINGSFTGNSIQAKSITTNGTINLNNSKLDGYLDVKGSAGLTNVTVSSNISTSGSTKLRNVTAANLDAKGSLDVNNSSLENVTLNGNEAVFSDSNTKNIIITSSKDQVIVRLSGKTTVDGLLEFTNNNGVVIVSNNTTISQGIVGGKLKAEATNPKIGPIINGREVKNK
jgi:hypothetical protein